METDDSVKSEVKVKFEVDEDADVLPAMARARRLQEEAAASAAAAAAATAAGTATAMTDGDSVVVVVRNTIYFFFNTNVYSFCFLFFEKKLQVKTEGRRDAGAAVAARLQQLKAMKAAGGSVGQQSGSGVSFAPDNNLPMSTRPAAGSGSSSGAQV